MRLESGLPGWQVGCEEFTKLRGIKEHETVCGRLDCCRFAEVARVARAIAGFTLAGILADGPPTYTRPATDCSVPAAVMTDPP